MNKIKIPQELRDKLSTIYSSRAPEIHNNNNTNINKIPMAPPLIPTALPLTKIPIPAVPPLTTLPEILPKPDPIKNTENSKPLDIVNVLNKSICETDPMASLLKFIVSEHISTYMELKEFKKNHSKKIDNKLQ